MKQILVLDGAEMQQAILAMVLRRPSMAGRFVGAVHLVCDPNEVRANLRIRCSVVHFDTEKMAVEYSNTPDAEAVKKADGEVTENLAGAPGVVS